MNASDEPCGDTTGTGEHNENSFVERDERE